MTGRVSKTENCPTVAVTTTSEDLDSTSTFTEESKILLGCEEGDKTGRPNCGLEYFEPANIGNDDRFLGCRNCNTWMDLAWAGNIILLVASILMVLIAYTRATPGQFNTYSDWVYWIGGVSIIVSLILIIGFPVNCTMKLEDALPDSTTFGFPVLDANSGIGIGLIFIIVIMFLQIGQIVCHRFAKEIKTPRSPAPAPAPAPAETKKPEETRQ